MLKLGNLPLGDKVFWGVALLLLVLMASLSFQGGINGDERFHVRQGESTIKWYKSFGKDKSFMTKAAEGGDMAGETTYIYGGLIDITSVLTNRVLGLGPKELGYHDVRHFIISLFGFLGILFCGLLAKRLLGWQAGIVALLFLFATPRYFGHSMFNPKDLPFAAAYMMSLYFLVRFVDEIPAPRRSTTIGLAIGIAMAINVRVGGLLLIAYLFLFTGLGIVQRYMKDKDLSTATYKKTYIALAIAAVAGYFGGLLFWPFGLMKPLSNPLAALTQFTQFHTNILLLFGGERVLANDLPWDYVTRWLSITTPLIVLAGVVPFVILLFRKFKEKANLMPYVVIVFALVFPMAYVVYKDSVLYDGLRHLLFVVPPLVLIGAVGWGYVLSLLKKPVLKYGLATVLLIGIANPLMYIFKNPTVAYTFFNPTVGGVKGAFGQYETDYYMLSARGACEWLAENMPDDGKVKVIASDCSYPVGVYMKSLREDIKLVYTRYYGRNEVAWDYAIFFSRFVDPAQMQNKTWPPDLAEHNVMVNDVPLMTVLHRKNTNDLDGIRAVRQKQFNQGIGLLTKAVQEQPNNETLWQELGSAYLNGGQSDKAVEALNKAISIYPNNVSTLYLLGMANLLQGQTYSGIQMLERAVALNPGFRQAFKPLADAYAQTGDQARSQYYRQRAQGR